MTFRTLVTIAFLLPASIASAQNNWYIKPAAGIAISNLRANDPTLGGVHIPTVRNDRLACNVAMNIGKRISHFDISTGVQVLTTGYKWDIVLTDINGNNRESGYFSYRYNHILVPLQLGYLVPLNKKLLFVPQLGAAFSYTGSVTSHIKTDRTDTRDASRIRPGSGANPFGVFGICRLNMEYAVNKRISISLAPAGYYMLTTFDDPPANAAFRPNQHNYSYGIDAGVLIDLAKRKAKEKIEPVTQ